MIRLRIREIAVIRGFNQSSLSRAANLDIKVVRRIFRNPYEIITTETLDKLARALQVNASSLLVSDPLLPDFEGEIEAVEVSDKGAEQ